MIAPGKKRFDILKQLKDRQVQEAEKELAELERRLETDFTDS